MSITHAIQKRARLSVYLLCVTVWTYAVFVDAAPIPAWQEEQVVEIAAFLSTVEIPGQDIPVPTVFEIPLPDGAGTSRQAIAANMDDGTYAKAVVLVRIDGMTTERVVRFLGQPGTRYRLYLDPDRPFGGVASGGVDLLDDAGVVVLQAMTTENPLYRPYEQDNDEDGIPDARDNCPRVGNTDQYDANSDAIGDACQDFDRDTVITAQDNCPTVPNRDQRDTDVDAIGDACDREEDRFTERNPWVPWAGMGIATSVLIGLLVLTLRRPLPGEGTLRDADAPSEQGTRTGTEL